MPIPDYESLLLPPLQIISDAEIHTSDEMTDRIFTIKWIDSDCFEEGR